MAVSHLLWPRLRYPLPNEPVQERLLARVSRLHASLSAQTWQMTLPMHSLHSNLLHTGQRLSSASMVTVQQPSQLASMSVSLTIMLVPIPSHLRALRPDVLPALPYTTPPCCLKHHSEKRADQLSSCRRNLNRSLCIGVTPLNLVHILIIHCGSALVNTSCPYT